MSQKIKLSEKYDQITSALSYSNKDSEQVKIFSIDPKYNTQKILDMRKAAEVHKEVRKLAKEKMKIGAKYLDVCNFIENKIVETFGKNDLTQGIGFLVGFSNKNCSAHDSAIVNDTRVIKTGDMIKCDFGTHVNGHIIDSAFTVSFANKAYDSLLNASKEAVFESIKLAGPDSLLSDISERMTEVVKSYEVEIDNKILEVNPCSYIGSHDILPYQIHGGKLIMNDIKSFPKNMLGVRMESGETYAIEVFSATGDGKTMIGNTPTTHYALNKDHKKINFNLDITQKVYGWIKKNRSTLPFASRWLHTVFGAKYYLGLAELVKKEVVTAYQPLVTKEGTMTAQLEHTIYLHEFGKEILSESTDY
jgi:methionyl aminopeptidase